MMHARQRGLTLVELMVVVAVMAIIATVAYPLYTAQVQKSRRADAKVALETIAMAQERFYTINGGYTAILSTLQVSTGHPGRRLRSRATTRLTNPVLSDVDTATVHRDGGTSGTGAQASDDGLRQFHDQSAGVKTATDGGSTNCW